MRLSPTSPPPIPLPCFPAGPCSYKYKYLSAVTASMPAVTLKDNYGTKVTVDCHGLLRVQHILSLRPSSAANAFTTGGASSMQGTDNVRLVQRIICLRLQCILGLCVLHRWGLRMPSPLAE